MIRSMTAFASGERATPWGTLGCELRSVNHRFLELGVRLPDELRALEPALRERVAGRVARGKIDLTLRLRSPEGEGALQLNAARLRELSELALDLDSRFPRLRTELTELLQFPGVLQSQATDPAELQAQALSLLDEVLDEFVRAREREGGKLAAVITERVDGIAALASEVRAMMPQIRAGQRTKLEARLADLAQPLDNGRLEQELVMWLQKLDVDEELDRLDSHVAEARRVLKLKEAVGRRLDFLLQEFNREANTLGSKSVDARSSAAAVELKVLIDQVREQIQNIE
ncbi:MULTISPECIES: YicC/YloC family endoribonuclease [Lysobacter]|uniref:YicC family protein n=1 Tax=Lysobacter soli TaxID=453783 RepID=A0A3D8V8Q3_9GAMM|nr:YicC/YloC family endoribonuclease [Lysobacter soli]QGW66274.1 YicC family protein [Lysobacter soli]RDY65802.1 YicC family protein [Lysobacter soli]UTA55296.1 YicC family protein [Lysobacter soli]